MNPVLFISHNATRTGAPMVLLHLCRWLSEHHPRGFEVVLGDGGDLEADFKALGPTTILGRVADPAGAGARLEALRERAARREFALVYANTVEVGDILDACAAPATPVVTHVHELDFWIRHQTGLERFAVVRDHTDRFIAVSEAVRTNLVTNRGVDAAAIDLVHECIDTTRWPPQREARPDAVSALGIPEHAWIVGGSGTLDWRKGPDLFVQVAGAVRRRNPGRPVHWIWVGGQAGGAAVAALRHDAERLGVGPCLHFVGEQREPAAFFGSFDLFVSTSREDPYPLVNLEAAAAATPIVCFDGSGGARELVEDDCGAVTPYLDVAAMADAVVRMLVSEAERRRAGARARAKVCERHDVTVAAPQVADLIERAIAAGPTAARLARTATRLRRPCAVPSPAVRTDDTMVALYRLASTCAAEGRHERARALFDTIIDEAGDRDPELAGKAWYKLATLDSTSDEALRCCERALALLPTHRAARDLRDALTATVLHG